MGKFFKPREGVNYAFLSFFQWGELKTSLTVHQSLSFSVLYEDLCWKSADFEAKFSENQSWGWGGLQFGMEESGLKKILLEKSQDMSYAVRGILSVDAYFREKYYTKGLSQNSNPIPHGMNRDHREGLQFSHAEWHCMQKRIVQNRLPDN